MGACKRSRYRRKVLTAVNIPATPDITVAGGFDCSVPVIDKIGPKSVKIQEIDRNIIR